MSTQILFDGFQPQSGDSEAISSFVSACKTEFALALYALNSVTFVAEFSAFCQNFDTGFGTNDPPDPSELAVGITPELLVQGELRSQIILPASVAERFRRPRSMQDRTETNYILAHELAHADEHYRRGQAFSAEVIDSHLNPNPLKLGARATWSEYYVCRKVAKVSPSMSQPMGETLIRATEEFGNLCSTAPERIRYVPDKDRLKGELISSGIRFLIAAARLLGHMDGLGKALNEECPSALLYIRDENLASTLREMHEVLRALWVAFPKWESLAVLDSILVPLNMCLTSI
jgi:hypothetical protein